MTTRKPTNSQLARLLLLVPWLAQNPGVTAKQAAVEFDVSVQQIERDLNTLIVCGLPGGYPSDLIDIQFWATNDDDDFSSSLIPADGHIHVLEPQSLNRPMAFTQDEVITLLVGLNALKDLPGAADSDLIDGVIAKLQDCAGSVLAQAPSLTVNAGDGQEDPAVKVVIDQAVNQRKQLKISYLVPARDEVTTRVIEPLRVVLVDGLTYIHAWCLSSEGERTFRLSRILDAELLDTPLTSREPSTDSFDEVLLNDPTIPEVVLDVTAAGRWLSEYATVTDAMDLPDGGMRITIKVADPRWVERMLLQAGGQAKVVEPSVIGASVLAQAQQALALYA
ncbi:MAG: WYL domain-containing protein [Actinomycetes bacterium]